MDSFNQRALFGLLSLLSLAISGVTQAKDKLSVLAIEYPPFTSAKISDDNLSRDLLSNYLKESALEIELKVLPLSRVLKLVNEGKWQASFVPVNDELEQDFCTLTYSNDELTYSIISMAENQGMALEGAKIATLNSRDGSPYTKLLTDLGLKIVPVNDYHQLFKLLDAGRVQFITGVVSDNQIILPSKKSSEKYVEVKVLSKLPLALYVNAESSYSAQLCDYKSSGASKK